MSWRWLSITKWWPPPRDIYIFFNHSHGYFCTHGMLQFITTCLLGIKKINVINEHIIKQLDMSVYSLTRSYLVSTWHHSPQCSSVNCRWRAGSDSVLKKQQKQVFFIVFDQPNRETNKRFIKMASACVVTTVLLYLDLLM